jgi:transcriptional regulator, XRE family
MQKEFSNVSDEEIAKFYSKISYKIRNLRESKGVSQLDLALEIGIKSAAFYSNCENNRYGKHFNLEHIYKISKALGVDIKEIFEL